MAPAKRRRRSTTIFSVLFLLIALSFIAVGVGLFLDREPDSTEIEILEQRLRDMRKLKTANRTYRSVIWVSESHFLKGRKEVLFSLEYEVIAGVNFSRGIEIESLDNGVFLVRMPEPEVFSWDAIESTIHQMIIREQSFFNQINMSDYSPKIFEQGLANREAAIEAGILDQAEVNARKAIIRVLRLGDIEEVVFEVLEPEGGDA